MLRPAIPRPIQRPALSLGPALALNPGRVTALFLGVISLSALLTAGSAHAQDPETQLASAVSVEVHDAAGKVLAKCDGTVIQEGLLMPLSILAGARTVEVTGRNGVHWTTSAVRSAKDDVDLALLALDPPPVKSIYVPRLPTFMPGGDVRIVRGPAAGSDTPIEGKTTAKFSMRGPDFIGLNILGPNGAPAFKSSGELVGVARGFDEPPYETGYLVPASSVLRLIEGVSGPTQIDELSPPIPPDYADKNSNRGLIFRGSILIANMKTEDARSFLTLAMKRDQNNPDGLFAWGSLLMMEKNYLDAAARYKLAAESAGNYAFAWHMAGVNFNNAGRYKDASTMYLNALKVDPNSAMTHCNLGGAYYNLGQFDLAVAEFLKSRELDERYWLAYTNLAFTYQRMGSTQQVEEIYQELLVKNPDLAGKLRRDLDTQK